MKKMDEIYIYEPKDSLEGRPQSGALAQHSCSVSRRHSQLSTLTKSGRDVAVRPSYLFGLISHGNNYYF